MKLDLNTGKQVAVLLGAGSMGTAIIRRIAAGKTLLFGDISQEKLDSVRKEFEYSGYAVETQIVNALDKQSVYDFAKRAAELGEVKYFIDTAGASPNQTTPEHIIELDLIGTGYAIDAFGEVMAKGGAGLIISSQTGYMLPVPAEVEQQILTLPTEQLSDIPYLKNEAVANTGIAYITAKRANHLQVQKAAAGAWADRRARINSISPGIIVTPLAYDEFAKAGEGYQKMIEASAARRAGTSDEIAAAGEFLLGESAGFITGTDLLIDGGTIAAMRTGRYTLGG